jgi:hypothetical protein
MQYFSNLPYITYTTPSGVSTSYRNLLTRVEIIPSILSNPLVYYTYDVKDGETPEIVAEKYYGDPYQYWVIFFANQMLDPQWDWPLSTNNFELYINDKYTNQGIDPYATIQSYIQTTTCENLTYQTTITTTVEITEQEYTNGQTSSQTINFPTETVKTSISYNTQSYYQYEWNLNESKRSIQLLNKDYLQQIQKEFVNLMS